MTVRSTTIRKSLGQRVFNAFNYLFFLLFAFLTLYPFWYTLIASLVPFTYFASHPLLLWPQMLTFSAYEALFKTSVIMDAYRVTVFTTVVGTACSLVMTSMAAFILSEKEFPMRGVIMTIILITMMFGGGLIPYYLALKSYGLINSVFVYIIPSAINTFYMIILKTHFQSIPSELKDAARIDGCNDVKILVRIFIPVSLPTLATLTLFYAVDRWNDLYTAIMFINDNNKYTLQAVLFNLIRKASSNTNTAGGNLHATVANEQVKFAAIMAATIPILIVYPFLQKYFVKGVMIGSIKG